MDLEHQASSRSCSELDMEELITNDTSQYSDALEVTLDNLEKSDGSATLTATAVWSQCDNVSQPASLDTASTNTTKNDTNDAHITLKNHSQFVDGKAEPENTSETVDLTLNTSDSAPIEVKPVSPRSDAQYGDDGPTSPVKLTPEACTTTAIHTEDNNFATLSPVASNNDLVNMYDDLDMPSSSPPVSSPLTSRYFRSSSPIPTASSPCGYNSTPPTSPVKIPTARNEPANIPIDEARDVEKPEFILDQSEETDQPDENAIATVMSTSGSPENCLTEINNPGENKDDAHLTDHGSTTRKKVYQRLTPGPRRATLAAQKVQHQRLSKPFRPPAVQKLVSNVNRENAISIVTSGEEYKPASGTSFGQRMQEKMKNRTAKAAAQFKSPLGSASTGAGTRPAVRPTPTIQGLERKLQMLKRAVKVKENAEEKILSGLIQKWTEAGREIAWEVWGLVKDNEEVENRAGRKRELGDSWGWQDGGDSKRQKMEERLWGWDVVPVHEREEEAKEQEEEGRRTLGTMLMEMGIGPGIFGWKEEEERFVD